MTLQLIDLQPSDNKDYDWSDYKLELPDQAPDGMGKKMEQIQKASAGLLGTAVIGTAAGAAALEYGMLKYDDYNRSLGRTLGDGGKNFPDITWEQYNTNCEYNYEDCWWGKEDGESASEFWQTKPDKIKGAVVGLMGVAAGTFLSNFFTGLLKGSDWAKIPKGDAIVLEPNEFHEFNQSVKKVGRSNNVNDVEFMVVATDRFNNIESSEDDLAMAYLGKWAFDAPTVGYLKSKVALPKYSNELSVFTEYDPWIKDGLPDLNKANHSSYPGVDYGIEYFGKQHYAGNSYWTWNLYFDGEII